MARLSRNYIAGAVLEGVVKAFKKYYQMSGGEWLCSAPESFIQSEIALVLRRECPFVTLEDTVRYLKRMSGHNLRGRLPRYSPSGRVDIVVWRSDEKPVCLIEVKKSYQTNSINDDVRRLRQLVSSVGSIHTGIVVSYTAAKRSEKIQERFRSLAENSSSVILGTPHIKELDGWHWGTSCFLVS